MIARWPWMSLVLKELPGALLIATTTLVMLVILSFLLGGENRSARDQTLRNSQEIVDHAAVTRCEFAYVVEILREIGQQSPNLNLDHIPNVNTDGLDCDTLVLEPFVPGGHIE